MDFATVINFMVFCSCARIRTFSSKIERKFAKETVFCSHCVEKGVSLEMKNSLTENLAFGLESPILETKIVLTII